MSERTEKNCPDKKPNGSKENLCLKVFYHVRLEGTSRIFLRTGSPAQRHSERKLLQKLEEKNRKSHFTILLIAEIL